MYALTSSFRCDVLRWQQDVDLRFSGAVGCLNRRSLPRIHLGAPKDRNVVHLGESLNGLGSQVQPAVHHNYGLGQNTPSDGHSREAPSNTHSESAAPNDLGLAAVAAEAGLDNATLQRRAVDDDLVDLVLEL